MLLVVHLLIENSFNVVFVIMFDLVDVLAVLAEHLLLAPPCIEFKPVRLLNAHLHISDLVGLSPCQLDLGQDSRLFKLKHADSVRQMQLVSFYRLSRLLGS